LANKYEPEVAMEEKVYTETYYRRHQPGIVEVDETPT
jgi:hypothetical protein